MYRINRLAKLLLGVLMALVIAFLFVQNNNRSDDNTGGNTMISHTIQKSVDTTSAQIQKFIKTLNQLK